MGDFTMRVFLNFFLYSKILFAIFTAEIFIKSSISNKQYL